MFKLLGIVLVVAAVFLFIGVQMEWIVVEFRFNIEAHPRLKIEQQNRVDKLLKGV